MSGVDYNHTANRHSLAGAHAAFAQVFAPDSPRSVLDVGCGTGTWLRAALDCGVPDVLGIDGIDVRGSGLLVPAAHFQTQDLCTAWTLGRTFDLALCLEVGEHLPSACAATLVDALTRHADRIGFSAACPNQPGQHHVNCQWPAYWQALFNARGFACDDAARWAIWDRAEIEPWYRQNLFVARRDAAAGREPRLRPVLHPEMRVEPPPPPVPFDAIVGQIEQGRMPATWYLTAPVPALLRKIFRRIR